MVGTRFTANASQLNAMKVYIANIFQEGSKTNPFYPGFDSLQNVQTPKILP